MIDKEKQYRRQEAWRKENKDRYDLKLPKGLKEEWAQAAAAAGKSLNQYIIDKVNQPD